MATPSSFCIVATDKKKEASRRKTRGFLFILAVQSIISFVATALAVWPAASGPFLPFSSRRDASVHHLTLGFPPFVIGRSKMDISRIGNFLFWEILVLAVGCCNPHGAVASMKKARYTKNYNRMLKALRETRKEAGLTQAEVGRAFGSHASFVSKCESGERRIDVIELAEFCRLYGVNLSQFLKKADLS
jgi:DNA-binding transcriptional regulator YiaG